LRCFRHLPNCPFPASDSDAARSAASKKVLAGVVVEDLGVADVGREHLDRLVPALLSVVHGLDCWVVLVRRVA